MVVKKCKDPDCKENKYYDCDVCGFGICEDHAFYCLDLECGKDLCDTCSIECGKCSERFCAKHSDNFKTCEKCEIFYCEKHVEKHPCTVKINESESDEPSDDAKL